MANPFDNLSNEELVSLLGGGGLTFDQHMKIATAPRSSSSTSSSVSSQDPAQFAENMRLLREQLRESSLGREQKTAIDKYLAQLQERNQRFVELKSAQDNLIKVAEQRETARQGDNNRKESARQANLRAAVDQYQTALSLIPQMGQLAIEESKRVQDILQNGGDFLARAFESQGGTSPLAKVLQADQINAVSGTIARLRQQIETALAGGPPDLNAGAYDAGTYQSPALAGGFGAQLGEMPTLDIPQAPPAQETEPASVASGGGGFSGAMAAPANDRGVTGPENNLPAPPTGFADYNVPAPQDYNVPAPAGYEFPAQSRGIDPNIFTAAGKGFGNYVREGFGTIPKVLGHLGGGLNATFGEFGRGFLGYAEGGMTREPMFMVGDHPSGMPMGTEEMIVNPPERDGKPHPVGVMNNAQTQQMMGGFSRYATGTGAYYDQSGNEVAGGVAMFGMPSANTPAGLTYRSNSTTPVPVSGGPSYGFNPWAGVVTPHASISGRPLPSNITPGSKEHLDWLKNGVPTPALTPVAPKVTQEQLVSMARRTSPPALQALFNNTSVPAQTALKSTVPGEDIYMKTPTARQWMSLMPEMQKAAQSRYNVEFNAGNGFVQNRIASLYGSTGSRQRGFVGAAGL